MQYLSTKFHIHLLENTDYDYGYSIEKAVLNTLKEIIPFSMKDILQSF